MQTQELKKGIVSFVCEVYSIRLNGEFWVNYFPGIVHSNARVSSMVVGTLEHASGPVRKESSVELG